MFNQGHFVKYLPVPYAPRIGKSKVRMGRELLRRPAAAPSKDRSVYEFLVDHYGEEANDYLAWETEGAIPVAAPSKLVLAALVALGRPCGRASD